MATVSYTYPVQGTTPPTATQAFNANSLSATLTFLDADTTALITHNWGEPSTTGLSYLWPWVNIYPVAVGTATVAPVISVALTNSVAVTVGKSLTAAGTGVGWTWNVILQRPFSEIT
jgi:hypothetical protein